ncbi:MAG: DNA helicase UvrD [Candidatus Omnitrophica bacterium CG11_big_fil_rev_8_21_14_0_20_42_13]|uniref:DNA helicase UvrD n=1 Tax=Candidatus Ghiorseimicrobium undicola TaxID=1974746 RepID=A0A2H0LVW1_9BACT|nr:MAG: DNA helicase UvrD [Candidatus Omnitrophica bacterium CG11_big_fil_rev_8_21_14_0_20_42_13]
MEFIADFHVHSKYSRATSKDMDVENISRWAGLKGITLMGTGDFTHHLWLEELKNKLEPEDNGLFIYKGIHFILTAEISSIYSKGGRGYRIHNLIFAPSFKTVDKINGVLGGIGNIASDGRPILGLDAEELARIVFDIDENCMIVPGHIWTPWFSLFGSMSGFDKIEDCFEKQAEKIFALETGLSSDPSMNWRLSGLDRFSLVSNSDSHSPQKIGREANVFDCQISYGAIRDALKNKDKSKFLYTIEFFPEEGKYHYDGHRACGIRFSPKQTKASNNKCPKCGKSVTVGVMNRVEQLADRPEGFIPDKSIPFKRVVPLDEIIAESKGLGRASKAVGQEYHNIILKFKTEHNVLLKATEKEIKQNISPRIAEGILRMRSGKVKLLAGYDGEYGIVSVFDDDEKAGKGEEQLSLF